MRIATNRLRPIHKPPDRASADITGDGVLDVSHVRDTDARRCERKPPLPGGSS